MVYIVVYKEQYRSVHESESYSHSELDLLSETILLSILQTAE